MDCPKGKGKGNTLAGLPNEAMLEILARAPFRSVCASKCVAKAWRDLIDDPHNRGRLPQTLQGFFSLFLTRGECDHLFVKYPASSVPLDIDPCFSFLATKLPETDHLGFLDSCNGLLLFSRYLKDSFYPDGQLGYIVCNPTTKHWVTVPAYAGNGTTRTYLAFNPAVSSHFHLMEFRSGSCDDNLLSLLSVRTYSSESGVWSHSQTDWNDNGRLNTYCTYGQRTFVDGLLHLMVSNQKRDQIVDVDAQGRISNQEPDQIGAADVQGRISNQEPHQIVAVDVQGRIKRTIKTPAAAQGRFFHYIGQSQGRLHYINVDSDAHGYGYRLSIWVLKDFDTQEWVLKDIVSFLSLFGRMGIEGYGDLPAWVARSEHWETDYKFVVIHPDRNVVFFVEDPKGLIAYDMDTKEVRVLGGRIRKFFVGEMIPYIPYFSQSPALTNKN